MANKEVTGTLKTLPWSADLALRAARVDRDLPKPDQEAMIEAKVAAGELPPEAVKALEGAGYRVNAT